VRVEDVGATAACHPRKWGSDDDSINKYIPTKCHQKQQKSHVSFQSEITIVPSSCTEKTRFSTNFQVTKTIKIIKNPSF
jgi:hypothetical protein